MAISVSDVSGGRDDRNDLTQVVVDAMLGPFNRVVRSYVAFNFLFLFLGTAELLALTVFFIRLSDSALLASMLALLFLTLFTYFILRIYLVSKKPVQFLRIRDTFVGMCCELYDYQEGLPESYFELANACIYCTRSLEGLEFSYYHPPRWLEVISPTMEYFSCWWHWEDLHRLRELLLQKAIDELLKLVRSEPTHLQVHTALANAYVTLSGLYVSPRTADRYDEDRWLPPAHLARELDEKFRYAAERAIEEFKILNDYAPDDPWIHAQLAYSYHDLQMPQEEIREYETVLRLKADDMDTLFRLGVLYFQQGMNAKGLQVYEELRRYHYEKAETLIGYYGSAHMT